MSTEKSKREAALAAEMAAAEASVDVGGTDAAAADETVRDETAGDVTDEDGLELEDLELDQLLNSATGVSSAGAAETDVVPLPSISHYALPPSYPHFAHVPLNNYVIAYWSCLHSASFGWQGVLTEAYRQDIAALLSPRQVQVREPPLALYTRPRTIHFVYI